MLAMRNNTYSILVDKGEREFMGDPLDSEIRKMSGLLSKKQKTFDSVMNISRDMIRLAGESITMLHNDERGAALKKIKDIGAKARAMQKIDSEFRYNSLQAYQEYAEAFCFYSIKTRRKLPKLSEVGVPYEAYLLGLMDTVGELKREVLESLRSNDIKTAEWYLEVMKKIYDSTRSVRFAEAVLSGFRRKQDVARIQIEGAGSEILSARHSRRA
jgi:translin